MMSDDDDDDGGEFGGGIDFEPVRAKMRAAIIAGRLIHCPCCTQTVKIYPRGINAAMARWFISLAGLSRRAMQRGADGFVHVNAAGRAIGASHSGDFAKLRYWGMIEAKPLEPGNKKKKSSGFWRPTQHGIDFIHDRVRVPSHAKILMRKFLGWKDPKKLVGIRDALKKKFNYEELMRMSLGPDPEPPRPPSDDPRSPRLL